MNRLTRCQIAELIEDSLAAQGFRGKTLPFVWAGMLFGSLFESRVPMETMTLPDTRSAGTAIVLLSPLVIAALLLASPFEWLRNRAIRRGFLKINKWEQSDGWLGGRRYGRRELKPHQ